MKRRVFAILPVVAILAVSLAFALPAIAQDGDAWCPPSTEETPAGCVIVSLWPSHVVGDYYLGDTLLATGVNPAQLVLAPNQSQRIDVRNVQSSEGGFGELFVYSDTSAFTYPLETSIRRYTAYPRKTFIRGTVVVPCNINGIAEGDDVACTVTIDDVPQAAPIPANTDARYILDTGSHNIVVGLTGATSSLWAPQQITRTAYLWAGGTSWLYTVFNKAGLINMSIAGEGLLADFYVDGELIASQVASTSSWQAPYRTHRVEARNITDPAAGDVYVWRDATSWVYLAPGQQRDTVLNPTQQYVQGFLSLTCNIQNAPPDAPVFCVTSHNGASIGTIPAGGTATYTLPTGSQQIMVELGPPGLFNANPHSTSVWISPGFTTSRTATLTIEQPEEPPVGPPMPPPGLPPAPPPPAPPPTGQGNGFGYVGCKCDSHMSDRPLLCRANPPGCSKQRSRWTQALTHGKLSLVGVKLRGVSLR